LHPRIAELLDYVEAQTAALRSAWDGIPEEWWGVRPAPDRWSPAEVIHHLAIVETRVAHRLAELVVRAGSLPPEEQSEPVLPAIDTASVAVRTERFRTSEAGEPRDTDATRVWQAYGEARRLLRRAASSGSGLALGQVRAPHPVLGEFNGYEWIAFAGSHAARHAVQLREIAAGLPPPSR